jgi:hypothetical protein
LSDLADSCRCLRIVRHQLLVDPRVPYTSKNSCCSLWLETRMPEAEGMPFLFELISAALQNRFQPGSDPGLCLAASVPAEVIRFGLRCQREVVGQELARQLAREYGIPLAGLGGTEDGLIGALAAVGLAASENDGRVVQIREQPDDLQGEQPVEVLWSRGVHEIRCHGSTDKITSGVVDVGKHLRPNVRGGQIVLFVEPIPEGRDRWRAIRLP